ncbi:MAG: hypothetical protein ACLGI3_05610 [Actinomycetes bacterium]
MSAPAHQDGRVAGHDGGTPSTLHAGRAEIVEPSPPLSCVNR